MSIENDPFDFLSLASTPEVVKAATTKPDLRQKFPCGQCAGTGVYRGARVHQEKSHCFSCKGKGYFLTDPRKLADRKAKKIQKEAQTKADGIAAFREAQPEMFAELDKEYRWHEGRNAFIASLAEQLFTKGFLTENQVAAWHRGKAKLEALRAERAAEQKVASVEVDLSAIRAMFEKAVEGGYKKPIYRAEGLVINRAPDHGNNPGALYVKSEAGDYFGKILGTVYHPTRDGKAAGATLTAIASDPLAAALRYGQRTGRCACCGRELTKHSSIDLGIGPICKEKWGL